VLATALQALQAESTRVDSALLYVSDHGPDGHFKFLHPWPGQIPPGQDSEECLSVG
jgi:glucan phosphoethanolaminetransferase (alkaline phosphatase superfamily)